MHIVHSTISIYYWYFTIKYITGIIYRSQVVSNPRLSLLHPFFNLIILITIFVLSIVLISWYSALRCINNRNKDLIQPSNNPTMSATQTFHPTQTLANDSRAQLEPWLEEFETHARNLCAQHDVACDRRPHPRRV
jgi:hypothetical protein